MRAFKTVNDTHIEPISFTVPRRAETFQADIFPPAIGSKPAVSAQEWLEGKTAVPNKIDLESVYEGTATKEIASDYKPPAQPTPAPAPAPAPEPKQEPEPAPAVTRAAPPSVTDQKKSMSAMANKYQDDEEEAKDDDDASSFEEIGRPTPRGSLPVRSEPPKPVVTTPSKPQASSIPRKVSSPSSPTPTSKPSTSGQTASSGSETSLDLIKTLLENQTKMINAQTTRLAFSPLRLRALGRRSVWAPRTRANASASWSWSLRKLVPRGTLKSCATCCRDEVGKRGF